MLSLGELGRRLISFYFKMVIYGSGQREVMRVIDDQETKLQLLKECHESLWAGHRGVWATYMKLKERYWWRGLYQNVVNFVSSCLHCQFYSKIRHRDGLVPTFPPIMHFQWVVDLVMMPPGMWGMKYFVLAREDLSNYVEGRALRSKTPKGICRFILEDIVCSYGSISSIRADRGDLDTGEAHDLFQRYGMKLKLTSTYNPEGIGKSERGHPPIVNALVKACDGKRRQWPRLLPFALWADRTTHCSTTGYMPVELMLGQKPIMHVENEVPTWATLPWEDGLDRESLLALRIRQLERREDDIQEAQKKLEAARLGNKERFDKTHRLRPQPIQPGDWVLVYDSSLENQHSTVHGTLVRVQVAGKRVKLFRRREGTNDLVDFLEPEDGTDHDFVVEEELHAEADD
ncbi:hypothetical protein R1sor_009104 [Riccia sorocarpa]|uniref:Integrase catalytic domain-containing protein n=1 Tax=Riccia sorocarpa TaxID=122646 RepID=A0ABD3H836_9MARC